MAIVLQRTANAISDSFLESAIAGSVKTKFIVADDNLVSYTGTSWNIIKELRFVRNTEEMNSNILLAKIETMALQGTSNIGIFLNLEDSPRNNRYSET